MMNMNDGDGGGQSPRGLLEAASDLEKNGAYGEALAIIERLLSGQPLKRDAFQVAARACFASFLDPAILAQRPSERRDALYRNLILQEATPNEPPALHACIASNHTAGIEGALAKSAVALTSTLTNLWDEGHREPSFLIMVLLLRAHLADWPYRDRISQWHLDLLPQFDRSHMTLPYNWVFDRKSFRDNVNDVAKALQSSSVEEIARRFAPWQIVLLHWITEGRSLDPRLPSLIDALKERSHSSNDASSTSDVAALRSLSLRAAVLGGKTGELDSACRSLAVQWSGLHVPEREDAKAQRIVDRLESKGWLAISAARSIVGQKMPYLKLGHRRPRVAFCVSGQLRGYRRAFPSWKPSILDGAECEFYVHSWKRLGRSGAEPFRAFLPFSGQAFCNAYRTEAHRIGLSEMMARYPVLFFRLVESDDITRDELCDFYGTDNVVIEDDSGDRFNGWSNTQKMHYKIAAAHDLVGERQSEFDLVLRIRPDKELGLAAFVWSDIVKAAARPVIFADIHFGHQYAAPIIGDQLAVGSPRVMRAYSDTIQIAPQLHAFGMFECPPDLHGHTSLARTCWHAGIDVRHFPIRMGRLLESDAMPAQDIADCLAEDASGRMDAMDRILLEAIRADLAS